MRQTLLTPLENAPILRRQLLHWAAGQPYGVFLDSNGHPGNWDCLAAAGADRLLEQGAGKAFQTLQDLQETSHDWLFGFLSYDLKNEVERLESRHPDGIGLPDMGFFRPETVAGIRNGILEIHTLLPDPAAVLTAILTTAVPEYPGRQPALTLQARISRPEYLDTVEAIRRHIIEGDIYELNFCQEFYAEQAEIDAAHTYERLNALGKAPFSAMLRWDYRWLLSASPERFLRKSGGTLISQPIKGTRARGRTPEEDALIRAELAASEKDRAENVMIVDLVRNDFARHCLPGSVVVDELFGIHSFETVHQMISTVRGTLRPGEHPVAALRDAFPMGSMTGAPKVMAMELIERYEQTRRGLYSGAVGYFSPDGDFDFNVVIRSILYNAVARYVSVQVGGAIVYDSVPEQEYEECRVKSDAMRRVLEND